LEICFSSLRLAIKDAAMLTCLRTEIIFEVRRDEVDGGYVVTALGHSIATQGETLDELREMVRDAVRCHFDDGVPGPMPQIIRLHFVSDEVLAV
jgi:predicted RNase H-like HicB family nuclease